MDSSRRAESIRRLGVRISSGALRSEALFVVVRSGSVAH
jgi:hypothetical protein